MRRAIILLTLLLAAIPAHATISFVQQLNAACTSSPCANTFASMGGSSPGSGHLLRMTSTGGVGATATAVSCSGGSGSCGTWVHCVACESSDAAAGSADIWYVLSSTSGATTLSVTMTGITSVFFGEVSTDQAGFILNAGATPDGKRDQSSNATSIAGVSLTLSAVNAVVFQGAACSQTCTAVSASYIGTFDANGNASAYKLNITSGTAPNWTSSPTGRAALTAISFQEVPAAATKRVPPMLGP